MQDSLSHCGRRPCPSERSVPVFPSGRCSDRGTGNSDDGTTVKLLSRSQEVQAFLASRLLHITSYFCFALTLAQRRLCAAAILRRDDADIVRLGATVALPLTFAQRAR
jgi:hypothetical protein